MGQTSRKDGRAFGTCDRCGKSFERVARGVPYRYCSRPCAVTPLAVRFDRNVQKGDGCWLWTGKKRADGYGEIEHGKRILKAHRVSLEMTGVTIPRGAEVCHHCDNPSCVNPAHLFVGSHTDNMRDMAAKGRAQPSGARGEAHGAAKLSAEQVEAIRADMRAQRVIAEDYGVTQSLISQIKARKVWR